MSSQINKASIIHRIKICFDFSLKALIGSYLLENKREISEIKSYADPIFNLLNKIEDIQNYLYDKNMTKFFYLNKKKIHPFLKDNDEIVFINWNKDNQSLYYLFYLDLLINDDKIITNYSYLLNYIENIFNLLEEEYFIKRLIISKIVITLIENYKQTDEYTEEKKEVEKLNKIQKECENFIKNDLQKLNLGLDINDIKTKNIDEIYIDIIISLFKNDTFKDYEHISKIMKELELESINITNKMLNKLLEFFNQIEEYKKYEISKIDDLSDIKKMNFYFILFKYILKNSFYIYQIPFLFNIRENHSIIYKS